MIKVWKCGVLRKSSAETMSEVSTSARSLDDRFPPSFLERTDNKFLDS